MDEASEGSRAQNVRRYPLLGLCVCVCVCVCVHTYINTHVHKYIHTVWMARSVVGKGMERVGQRGKVL